MTDRIRAHLAGATELPAIVAPMFLVSSPALVLATCGEGLIGSFPAHATRTRAELEAWLVEIEAGLQREAETAGGKVAPYAVNLVTHETNARMAGDLELCVRYRVPIVLTSKSAPRDVVARVHDYGGIVLHDIATRRHAEKALASGVDGLILVSQGAGGHTGSISPFGLMNEVRAIYDGPIVLAGGIMTGRDILAAEAMGADFAYLGTRFIATPESIASDAYKAALIEADATGLFYSAAVDGAPVNWLAKSLIAAGADLDALRVTPPGKVLSSAEVGKRWVDVWSAGHGVGLVRGVTPARELCRQLKAEYAAARAAMAARLAS